MAHINGLINMMNGLSSKTENHSQIMRELSNKVLKLEEANKQKQEPIQSQTSTHLLTRENDTAISEIRNNIIQIEKTLRDTISKERMLIENTVMAKAEELVKKIVSEKVSCETQLIASEMKMLIQEMHDQDSDTMSLAQSEIRSITQKKKGGKKVYDL